MYEIRKLKTQIRTTYIEKRKELSEEKKCAFDNKICSIFMSLVTYRYSDIILMYAPKNNEINIYKIAEQALIGGKAVAFPKCDTESCTMQYYIITSLSQLEKGEYGIMEPNTDLPIYHDNNDEFKNPVCLVPGVVYDKKGYRLGHGKGYYDRYLIGFKGVKVGLVYNEFVINQVPIGRYDLSVDVMVTEKGVKAVYAG